MKPEAHWLKRADAFLAKHNPCRIKPNPNGGITCMAGNGCCQGCRHLRKEGCSVKALACKLWLCGTAYDALPFLAKVELYTLLHECDVSLWYRYDSYIIQKEEMFMFPGWFDPREEQLPA